MVKPVFRRKSIGTKVSEEEYAQLQALAEGRAMSEWVREVLLRGKRRPELSITHKFGPHDETKFNVCESGQTSPDDAIPGRSIARTGQIAAQSGEFG